MGKDLTKTFRKANKTAQKSLKQYSKKMQKETRLARKNLEKSYGKMSFGQKVGILGTVIIAVSMISGFLGRVSKQ